MDSSSSEDDDDDIHLLAHLFKEVCDMEANAKIRGYIDEIVSQYSEYDVII